MIRFGERTENGIRATAMFVTVAALLWLMWFFSDSLISCLLLVWKHMVEGLEVPVIGETREIEIDLITRGSFCAAVMAVYGMRKRLEDVFRGKSAKWYAVLALPLLVVAVVTYAANWGAQYGILYRSGGDIGLYYDQIFSYIGWAVLSGLSLFAIGAYIFGMNRIYVEQKKAQQYQAQAAVYQMLEEQYSQAERLRHDLKNHVFALRGLWEEQAWEKLGDYLKKMEDSAQFGTNEEATGNRAIDALLCQKRKLAEEKGIDWECNVRIPQQCYINEFDLCILFGNLLDNAVEACERLLKKGKGQERGGQPFIRMQAGNVKSCLLMEVKNSMDAEEKRTGGSAKEKNPQGHGIGLLNVRDVVRRYNGVMNTQAQGGIFTISLLLPLGQTAYDIERAV